MHFRILKMIATSGFLTALECTKFDFGRAPPRTPLVELTALPRPLAGVRGLLLRGGEGKGRERRGGEGGEEVGEGKGTGEMEGKGQGMGDARERRGKGRGREEEEEEGSDGEGRKVRTPPPSIPAYAPAMT